MASIRSNIMQAIGHTPLIRLNGPSAATGCEILGKAEFMNPGGSVKDRAGRFIIEDALEAGTLRPGGLIVEGTAGNTGIGLAMVAASVGCRTLIVIPETQSVEKFQALEMAGARLHKVPAAPYRDPGNYVRVSERLAGELAAQEPNGVMWANQWDNESNWRGHYRTTGPEILEQTGGRLDGFICAIGTGGTLAGVGTFLREHLPDVRLGLADPDGAAMFSWFSCGELASSGSSITEGIGQGRITGNVAQVEQNGVDFPFRVPDAEALEVLFRLVQEEGLCLGSSSGINVAGAIRLAQELGPGHVIVTILCDSGSRYASKLYQPSFLRSKDLPVPPWMESDAG